MDKDGDLEALFAAASAERPEPSAALMARILQDAARLQPAPQVLGPALVSPPPRAGFAAWLAGVSAALGGGRALAGLSLAGMTGLFLGVAEPAMLGSVTAMLAGSTTSEQIDLLPDSSTLWTED